MMKCCYIKCTVLALTDLGSLGTLWTKLCESKSLANGLFSKSFMRQSEMKLLKHFDHMEGL